MNTPLRVLFLGTPDFAVPTLKALIEFADTDVVGVVCQPDRPSGRGNKLKAPPVKALALEHKIAVLQPESLARSPETVQQMQDLKPDLIVMVAFGQILKKNVLNMPTYGVMNLHGSLLPKYRGAAPINWSIINGESETGNTTMFTDPGVDTGPMLLKQTVPIGLDTTAEELARTLSVAGSKLIIETIKSLIAGSLVPQAQDNAEASYAPMLSKETGRIDWRRSAREIHNLVRGLIPWPTAHASFQNTPLKVLKTRLPDGSEKEGLSGVLSPGTIEKMGEHVYVACGDGTDFLELITVQPPNKNRMDAHAWANGMRLSRGEAFDI